LFQVGQQLLLARPTEKVPTQHLVGSQCWLASRPQTDQHAGDNRTVGLDGNTVRTGTQQMLAAEHVLEESKEYLNRPSIPVEQCDDLRRHVEQIGQEKGTGYI